MSNYVRSPKRLRRSLYAPGVGGAATHSVRWVRRRHGMVPGGILGQEAADLPVMQVPWTERTAVTWTGKQTLVVAIVILLVVVAVYYAGKAAERPKPTPTQAVRRLSTNRLSKELYGRLERNGRGSRRTKAALAQLGR